MGETGPYINGLGPQICAFQCHCLQLEDREKTPVLQIPLPIIPRTWSPFWSHLTTHCSFIITYMEEQWWVVVQACARIGSFLVISLALAPGRQKISLTEVSVWMFCSSQKKVTYNYNLSFLPCDTNDTSCDTRDGLFWLWHSLWYRGTVTNIIHQLAFPIQIPIPVAQMGKQVGRWGGQEEGSCAALSMDLTLFTLFL